MAAKTSRTVASEIAFLTRALRAPSLAASVERLAERVCRISALSPARLTHRRALPRPHRAE